MQNYYRFASSFIRLNESWKIIPGRPSGGPSWNTRLSGPIVQNSTGSPTRPKSFQRKRMCLASTIVMMLLMVMMMMMMVIIITTIIDNIILISTIFHLLRAQDPGRTVQRRRLLQPSRWLWVSRFPVVHMELLFVHWFLIQYILDIEVLLSLFVWFFFDTWYLHHFFPAYQLLPSSWEYFFCKYKLLVMLAGPPGSLWEAWSSQQACFFTTQLSLFYTSHCLFVVHLGVSTNRRPPNHQF